MLLRGSDMSGQKPAFTLVEIILAVIFLGIMAVIAIPRISFSGSSRQQVDNLARKFVTDLRRTRMLAISNAATNTTGFTLQMTGSAPYYSGYQIIDDSNTPGTVVDSQTIDSTILISGSQVSFGPLGNVRAGSLMLQITAQNRRYVIFITRSTGMVKWTRY
jgi:Tfp pilus assembly protein FimT